MYFRNNKHPVICIERKKISLNLPTQPAEISLGLKVHPSSQIQYASCPSALQYACSPQVTSSHGAKNKDKIIYY